MFNKCVFVILLFLVLFSGCEKKTGDSVAGLTDETADSSTNEGAALENSSGFPLGAAKIKSVYNYKKTIITAYEKPNILTDEIMSSIEIDGHIIKLPTTLEELGNDYKLTGKFKSTKLGFDDEKGLSYSTVNTRVCVLNYKENH